MQVFVDGPIVCIDDDEDDQLLLKQALGELGLANPLHSFTDGHTALSYLQTTQDKPLLILCEVNLAQMSGLDLRRRIDEDPYLRQKSIPFLFYTSSASPQLVKLAYQGTIQGFHIKVDDFARLKEQLALIVAYWQSCLHPNSFS